MRVFWTCLLLLVLASLALRATAPGRDSDRPLLTWVTDAGPTRFTEADAFRAWQRRHPDAPPFDIRIDSVNRDVAKMLVQGASGVGGDLLDIWTGRGDLLQFHAMGLLADVTDDAAALGFTPDRTWPALEREITVENERGERRQYAFPGMMTSHAYWVNTDAFRALGLPPPPRRWTFDEFEAAGRAFVAAANRPGQRQTAFFFTGVETWVWFRSLGLDTFNETLTRCTLDDPRYVETLERLHRWTYDDHLTPTRAEAASLTGAGPQGGARYLLAQGRFGLVYSGRYAVVTLRQYPGIDWSVSEPPHGGFPNASSGTRCIAIYAGSQHKDLARHFLRALADEEHNLEVVRNGTSEPPVPRYTQTEAFLRPPQYPLEWDCHEVFAEQDRSTAIGGSFSPFVSAYVVDRIRVEAEDRFMAGLSDARAAAADAAARVNAEIDRTLATDTKLAERHRVAAERQRQIDALRAAGRPVPLQWIDNPFHRRYYVAMGWSEPQP